MSEARQDLLDLLRKILIVFDEAGVRQLFGPLLHKFRHDRRNRGVAPLRFFVQAFGYRGGERDCFSDRRHAGKYELTSMNMQPARGGEAVSRISLR